MSKRLITQKSCFSIFKGSQSTHGKQVSLQNNQMQSLTLVGTRNHSLPLRQNSRAFISYMSLFIDQSIYQHPDPKLSLLLVRHCSMRGKYGRRVSYKSQQMNVNKGIHPYLGLMRCAMVKKTPNMTQRPPTTMYAIPRKSFFPPMTVLVERRMDLLPPYKVTLKTALC